MYISPQQFLPWLFPKLLGGIYLIGFASLLPQVLGLYGTAGILPIADYLKELRKDMGKRAYRIAPSLFWFNSSDAVLKGACLLGMILSLALVIGGPPAPLLLIIWILYLSFSAAGQEFLSYQWDSLLQELGFMTIFLPLVAPSPPLVVFTYRFFLFRFIFSSGIVKILSGDPTWRGLTALRYHYETQPLPNRFAWFAHQLPPRVQKLSTALTLIFEILVPFLIFTHGPARFSCFLLLLFLQGLIFATGSYGYFNLLSAVFTVPLLSDRILGSFVSLPMATATSLESTLITWLFALFLALNMGQLLALFYRPFWLRRLLVHLSPFMISNHYGLFAVMTTKRFELELEGSRDGTEWHPYRFRWKPGDPGRAPRQAAPHQPRLDWQMWFAALDPMNLEPWVVNLVVRLLQGSTVVTRLLAENPFPVTPPEQIRVTVYRYHFTDIKTLRTERRWWERSMVGRYQPIKLKGTSSAHE